MGPVPALSARDAAPAGDCDELPRQARLSAHAPDPQAGFYMAPISTGERRGDEVLARVLLVLLAVLLAAGALFACDAMAKMDAARLIQPYDPFNPSCS